MREVPYKSSGRDSNRMMEEFREFIESKRKGRDGRNSRSDYSRHSHRNRDDYEDDDDYYNERSHRSRRHDDDGMMQMMEMMYGYRSGNNREHSNKHFNEKEAYETVDDMYHVKDDKKYVGEHYPMDKAHEVREKHSLLDYTIADIYVALNAQYHDYCELFEKWFASNSDSKLIESAIDFWFFDDDFEGNKVWMYFNEME